MHNTEPITPTASGPPTLRDAVAEIDPIIGAVFVAGPPVLVAWAGTVLFALMLAGPFALLVAFVVAVAAAAALVTLAGAILATPYLLIRHFRPRLAKRPHVSEAPAPIAAVVAAGAAR
jgi:predicted lipid-binding transport protein (Tim44 family)